eukprot:5323970-Pleurochrysis_carterae.AAC.2
MTSIIKCGTAGSLSRQLQGGCAAAAVCQEDGPTNEDCAAGNGTFNATHFRSTQCKMSWASGDAPFMHRCRSLYADEMH